MNKDKAMDNVEKLNVLAGTMPQLFEADSLGNVVELKLENDIVKRYATRSLTPVLKSYKEKCQNYLRSNPLLPSSSVAKNLLTEVFAQEWLELRTSIPKEVFRQIMDYFYELGRRTNENDFVHKNIKVIINFDSISSLNLFDKRCHKAIDLIGSSPHTLIAIDTKLKIIGTESIDPSELDVSSSYSFYPAFLKNIAESSSSDQVVFTSTARGDLLVCHEKMLIASKRRDRWTVYDPATFKNTIYDLIGSYGLSCTLYGILWDLSYKRHGGLIIVDRDENFQNYTEMTGELHQLLQSVIPLESFDSISVGVKLKKLFLELASIDGAVLISSQTGKIAGVGKNITKHPNCPSRFFGARTTAAYSAALWGAKSLKVSADGDITIYKKIGSEIVTLSYM